MSSTLKEVDQRTQLVGKNRLELLLFQLNGAQQYAINVFKVREVVHCPHLTHIPNSHPAIKGVATVRGKTLPVMDLGMAMGGLPLENEENCFVIVTEFNRDVLGFLVRGVNRIVNMDWGNISAPPAGVSGGSYLTAVTHIDDQLVEIIDVEKARAEVIGEIVDPSEDVVADVKPSAAPMSPVLVVDDSSMAREQIKRTLVKLGFHCTLAINGCDALEKLRFWAESEQSLEEHLCLVLSDIEMPEMDGYTLTSEIRKDPRLAHLPIILHSSLSGIFNNDMIKKVGADHFIPKYNPDELGQIVLGLLADVDGQKGKSDGI